eukprot:8362-Pleurochrysis_carterae.AAC.1
MADADLQASFSPLPHTTVVRGAQLTQLGLAASSFKRNTQRDREPYCDARCLRAGDSLHRRAANKDGHSRH